MRIKTITTLIAGAVFTAGLIMGFGGYVFAAENYNSSKSNTATSIGIGKIHEYVGNILLPYGVGGMEINRVNDALDIGITKDKLTVILTDILVNVGPGTASGEGVSDKIQAILLEFDKIGIGDTPQPAPATGKSRVTDDNSPPKTDASGAAPSAAEPVPGIDISLDEIPAKRAKPAPAVTTPTSLTYTTALKNNIELMLNTIGKIQERLKDCDNIKVCDIVEDHAKQRADVTDTTQKAIENRNWEEATRLLHKVRGIVVGDIKLLEGVEDKGLIADVLGLERALLNQTDSALKKMSALKPASAGTGEQRFKSIDGLDSETRRSSMFIKLGDLPGKQAIFHDAQQEILAEFDRYEEGKSVREITDKIEKLQANRKTFQTEIVAMNLSIRENAKDLRDNFRENVRTTIGHVDHGKTARIAVAHGNGLRMINRYRSAIARFNHILGRLESRIEKIGIELEKQARANGKVIAINPPKSVILLIEEAKNTQVENEAKLAELEAKYESLLLGENPGRIAEEARAIAKELKSEIEKLHDLLGDIQQATGTINTTKSNTF